VAWLDNFQSGHGVWGAGKVGHRGLLGHYLETDLVLVRYDSDTEQPYRNPKTGFCVKVKTGEVGEAIGKVVDPARLTIYLNNKTATDEKLITNVFEKGDLYQRSGDLLAFNSDGWFHFVDRVGDTYRWKGENVAAGEVRDHIASLHGVIDATIYGLRLDAYDGQAGCAALFLDKSVSGPTFMDSLWKELRGRGLPAYAIPRLVRIEEQKSAPTKAPLILVLR
jgi:acyl-CoA synthetase (AMP-forming)/AMP-acid ligase II